VTSPLALHASQQQQTVTEHANVNPIRKVVTMLQNMQKKVEVEGKKEEELFEKFMCYCKGGKDTLVAGQSESTHVSQLRWRTVPLVDKRLLSPRRQAPPRSLLWHLA
jgi:hypothetical protein